MSRRLADAVGVSAVALVGEGLLGALDLWATGALGMGGPLVGMVLGVALALSLRARRDPTWLTRDRLRRLAVDVAGVHFLVLGLAYATGSGLSGAARLLGMGALGLLGALASGAVVMCVGDGVAMVLSPFSDLPREGGPGGPAGPWRRR